MANLMSVSRLTRLAVGFAMCAFGIAGETFLAVQPAAAIAAGYGEGSGFCATVTSSGYDLGANFDNVWACGPIPGASGEPGYGDSFEQAPYGFQCIELADRFLWDAWGIDPVFGADLNGANYADTVHADNPSVSLVTNGTANKPYLPGDVVSFTGGPDDDGHVAVVTGSSENSTGDGTVSLTEEDASSSGQTKATVSNWSMGTPAGSDVTPYDFDALASDATQPSKIQREADLILQGLEPNIESSGIIRYQDTEAMAVATLEGPGGERYSTGFFLYHWGTGKWNQIADVPIPTGLYSGSFTGMRPITQWSFSGLPGRVFLVMSASPGLSDDLSVIALMGGHWKAVRFGPLPADTTIQVGRSSAKVLHHDGIEGQLCKDSSCKTTLYRYSDGMFVPQ